ncbi:MAG: hypothetical protein H7322_05635 [Ramlibacter sp.]|nr:hypothetical protein [Ramlibacter sp.]
MLDDGAPVMLPVVLDASLLAPAGPPMVLVLLGLPAVSVLLPVAEVPAVPVEPVEFDMPEADDLSVLLDAGGGMLLEVLLPVPMVLEDVSSFLPQAVSDRTAAAARTRMDERVMVLVFISKDSFLDFKLDQRRRSALAAAFSGRLAGLLHGAVGGGCAVGGSVFGAAGLAPGVFGLHVGVGRFAGLGVGRARAGSVTDARMGWVGGFHGFAPC